MLRIGTWNLDGRASPAHVAFVRDVECDIWLLTEVGDRFELPGGGLVRSAVMRAGKSWAAVWGAVATPVPNGSPHPASALALVEGLRLCSSVLPWRAARAHWPDLGPDAATITKTTLDSLRRGLVGDGTPLVWGGDWNHSLVGPERVGTHAGRAGIASLVRELDLAVPTAGLPHVRAEMSSIDHIAVPSAWGVVESTRLAAWAFGRRLSDHDAYVVEVEPGPAAPLSGVGLATGGDGGVM